MTVLDLDNRNRAHVSEKEFMDYISRTARRDDYTKEIQLECQVADKDWRYCDCLVYYNSAGCMLALYNRDFEYGELL